MSINQNDSYGWEKERKSKLAPAGSWVGPSSSGSSSGYVTNKICPDVGPPVKTIKKDVKEMDENYSWLDNSNPYSLRTEKEQPPQIDPKEWDKYEKKIDTSKEYNAPFYKCPYCNWNKKIEARNYGGNLQFELYEKSFRSHLFKKHRQQLLDLLLAEIVEYTIKENLYDTNQIAL